MTGPELKQARLGARLTQAVASARLGLSQAYLSQLERGRRELTPRLARAAAKLYRLPPTSLPPPAGEAQAKESPGRLPHRLAALGYPGFGHLRKGALVNPAVVVLDALTEQSLDGRVAEALPWVLEKFPALDWKWLTARAKLRDVQNRLGFLVAVAHLFAERRRNDAAARTLARVAEELEGSRLVAETTLGRASMPDAEREWLRANRSPEARHWNVLAGLNARDLPYA